MRIAVIANTTWYLSNFRLNLMLALVEQGHEVIAVAPSDGHEEGIRQNTGISHQHVSLNGARINPLKESVSVFKLFRVLHKEKVDLVLSYTPKGNIYSSLAAAVLGIPVIANVSGLGRAFIKQNLLTHFVKLLYKITFRRKCWVFFQNMDDLNLFLSMRLVSPDKVERLPGSGVDLSRFVPSEEESNGGHEYLTDDSNAPKTFIFLLVARLLWDKGVGEFVTAARTIRAKHPNTKFQLLGFIDVDNPSAVPRTQIDIWSREKLIDYLGSTNDVRDYVRKADCVVLPSYYREGVPRSLLEAAAMAKPLLTTDAAGCRDAVEDGVTGYLCEVRNADDLARKMEKLIGLSDQERCEMGRRGREKMVREFSEMFVINRYLEVIQQF